MTTPRSVLITGSTSGIGLGIAHRFAEAGYNILFNGLEANGAQIAADVSKKYGVQTVYSPANMMAPDEIVAMVQLAEKRFGGLDIVVNNAGIQHVAPIEEFPIAKWDAIVAINMSASFHTARAAWLGMKARKFGRIVNITSAHGLVASEFKSAYVAAKHGISGLTKVLALEGAPFGITCNAICPGYVKTPLVEGQIEDQAKAHGISEEEVIAKVLLAKQPVKRFIPVESIGALALFLASEHGALITGASIPIEGGWTAQ